ncbi:uncharacterized protein AKAME5_001988800 [Lates japonicus]|uniref:Ig-like domain-containing protein n=1 Tax=Lates japonicus TaxID=270547 RepID=A0AAD3N9Y9_LATJO|nr:uncharacterized protein AKAME5_001988800 [Lates japonicus]
MKASSGSLILGLAALLLPGLTVSAVFLNARPNRLQFLTEESVSLSCEGQQSSAGWTVRRTAGGGKTQRCGDGPQDFGSFDGSSCIISDLSTLSDSGVYWCENSDGHKTPELNITVSAALVSLSVLVSILAGVLLLCKRQAGLAVQLLSGLAVSAGLAVLLLSGLTVSAGAFPPPTVSTVRLLCHLVVFCPYCMSTILMLSIYCSRKTGNKQPVSRETADRVDCEDYGNVTTEHAF